MKSTEICSGSLLVSERRAVVGCPFTSFMPKISDWGKEVEILTDRAGLVEGCSTSASAWREVLVSW